MRALLLVVFLLTAAPRDGADDQYQFIAGLADKGMHERVVAEAGTFLTAYPRHAKAELARYRLACALFELHRTKEATEQFSALARRRGFEFESEVAFRLGQCELDQGDCKGAEQAFARAVELDKEYLRAPARWLLGEARFRCDRFAEAEASYQAALEADPSGEYADDAAAGLAWCAFKAGRFPDAAERAQRYVSAYPKGERAGEMRFLGGESLLELGRPKDALKAYAKVGDGPFADGALRGTAFALAALEDHAQAAEAFAALVERFPDSRFAPECALHGGIEWLATSKEPEAARRALVLLTSKPAGEGAELLSWRARAQAQAGDREAALATIDRALAAKPDAETAKRLRGSRGDLLLALGRRDEGIGELQRSGSDYALQAAAVASLAAGKPAEAVQLAGQLLERYPQSPYAREARMALGEGWFAQSDWARAEQAFAAAAQDDEDAARRARALGRVAWCRYQRKDVAGAAQLFGEVARSGADAQTAEEAAFMEGRAREAAGDKEGAARAYGDYQKRFAQGAHADESLLRRARMEDDAQCVALLEGLLRRRPDSPVAAEASYELGERLSAAGKLDEAGARYRDVLENHGDTALAPAARYGLAWCMHGGGDEAGAAALLEPWLADAKGDAELRVSALELLVWTRATLADPQALAAAWKAFSAACTDDARLARAGQVACASLRKAGRAPEAGAVIDSLARRVKDPAALARLAGDRIELLLDQKQVDEADRALEKALATAPGDPELARAAFLVGEARSEAGANERALALYDLAGKNAQNPVRDRALYKAGFARLRAGDAAGAERGFGELVQACPKSDLLYESLFLLGEAQYRQGRFEQAIASLKRVRTESPKHAVTPKVLFRLGLACAELQDWQGAVDALALLAREHADFENAAEAELVRGRALAALGRGRDARAAFERTLALDKGALSARAHLELGKLQLAARELDPALSEFLKVAVLYELDDEVAEALVLAGNVLEAQGDAPRAAEQYREVLEKHAKTRFAAQATERLKALGAAKPKKDLRGV